MYALMCHMQPPRVPAANAVLPVKRIMQTVTRTRPMAAKHIWALLITAEHAEIHACSLTAMESAPIINVYWSAVMKDGMTATRIPLTGVK